MLDFLLKFQQNLTLLLLFRGEQMEPTKYFVLPIPDSFLYSQQKLVTRWGIIDDLMNKKGHHKPS
jgi:hypothetical protein